MKVIEKKHFKFLTTIFFIFFTNLIFTTNSYSEEVGWGGLFTSEKFIDEQIKKRNEQIRNKIEKTLRLLNEENKLPFKILFETDSEEIKSKINDDKYSLAVVITRDDVATEKFESDDKSIVINKLLINVGMVVILYQTVDELNEVGKKKNSIVFSFPLVGYSMNLTGEKTMSQEEIYKNFVDVATKTFEEELVEKLQKISLGKITGTIKSILDDGKAKINIGSLDGLIKGQKVNILISYDKTISKGKVEDLTKNEGIISFDDKNFIPKETMIIEASNIKGLSDDTYQVVEFKVSSEKCKKVFDNNIGSQASQWFSDFLSARGGKVVLPSKVGNNWVETSNENSFAVFIKDGQEHLFEVAKPKYQVKLDLTGLSSQMIEEESNSINQNWIFKLWLNVEIPEKKFSKEFDMLSTKSLIVGTQTFKEKSEVIDLLHQLTAKVAKDIE